jgi:heme oxygenase
VLELSRWREFEKGYNERIRRADEIREAREAAKEAFMRRL